MSPLYSRKIILCDGTDGFSDSLVHLDRRVKKLIMSPASYIHSVTFSYSIFHQYLPWLMCFEVFSSWCNFSPWAPGNCFLSLWIHLEALLREMSSDLRPNQIVWSQEEGLVEMASNVAWGSPMTAPRHCLINLQWWATDVTLALKVGLIWSWFIQRT